MHPLILIADDDPELLDLYQCYLRRFGYRVRTASGAVDCLSILQEESPAVIVASIDLAWGGTDGLLQCLLEEAEHRFGPSVILTGCTAEENVAELRENPCVFRYLSKPFLMGKLLDCIRAIESECAVDRVIDPRFRSRRFAVAAT